LLRLLLRCPESSHLFHRKDEDACVFCCPNQYSIQYFKPISMKIAPSLLSADFANLGASARVVTQAGADWLHWDVMDGHFVPNLTIGADVMAAVRPYSDLPFDVHLMIAPVDAFIPLFAKAGADRLTIHPEAGPHLHRSLQLIRAAGCKVGVALNPATPLEVLQPVLGDIDQVLMMTVNPGFGGQQFIPQGLARVAAVKAMILEAGRQVGGDEGQIELVVDGGVNPVTAGQLWAAGASVLVAGTAVFGGTDGDYAAKIQRLKNAPLHEQD
jgi:ribulose-phosphate 3-epimerase